MLSLETLRCRHDDPCCLILKLKKGLLMSDAGHEGGKKVLEPHWNTWSWTMFPMLKVSLTKVLQFHLVWLSSGQCPIQAGTAPLLMWFGFGQEVNRQIKAQILSTDLLNPAGLAGGCLQETVTHFYCDHTHKKKWVRPALWAGWLWRRDSLWGPKYVAVTWPES